MCVAEFGLGPHGYLSLQVGVGILASTNPAYHRFLQSALLLGWMASCVVLVAGPTAAIKKAERRHLYNRQRDIETIRALSWIEFEQLVGEAYRRWSYQVTETGSVTRRFRMGGLSIEGKFATSRLDLVTEPTKFSTAAVPSNPDEHRNRTADLGSAGFRKPV